MKSKSNLSVIFTDEQIKVIDQRWQALKYPEQPPQKSKNPLTTNKLDSESQVLKKKIIKIVSETKERYTKQLNTSSNQNLTAQIVKTIQIFIKYSQADARQQINKMEGELKNIFTVFLNKYFCDFICIDKRFLLPINKYFTAISNQKSTIQEISDYYSNLTDIQQDYFNGFQREIRRLKEEQKKIVILKNMKSQSQLMKILNFESINDEINTKNRLIQEKDNLINKLEKINLILKELGQLQINYQKQNLYRMTQKRISQFQETFKAPLIKVYHIIKRGCQQINLFAKDKLYRSELIESIELLKMKQRQLQIKNDNLRKQRASIANETKKQEFSKKEQNDKNNKNQEMLDLQQKYEALQLQLIRKKEQQKSNKAKLQDYVTTKKKNSAYENKIKFLQAKFKLFQNQKSQQLNEATQKIKALTTLNNELTSSINTMKEQSKSISLNLLTVQDQNQILQNIFKVQNAKISETQTIKMLRINERRQKKYSQNLQSLLQNQKKTNNLLQSELTSMKDQLEQAKMIIRELRKKIQISLNSHIIQSSQFQFHSPPLQDNESISQELKAIQQQNQQLKQAIQEKNSIFNHIMLNGEAKDKQNQIKITELQLKIIDLRNEISKNMDCKKYELIIDDMKNNETRLKTQINELTIKLYKNIQEKATLSTHRAQ